VPRRPFRLGLRCRCASRGRFLPPTPRAMNRCAVSGEAVHALAVAEELRRIRATLEGLLP